MSARAAPRVELKLDAYGQVGMPGVPVVLIARRWAMFVGRAGLAALAMATAGGASLRT